MFILFAIIYSFKYKIYQFFVFKAQIIIYNKMEFLVGFSFGFTISIGFGLIWYLFIKKINDFDKIRYDFLDEYKSLDNLPTIESDFDYEQFITTQYYCY